MECISVVIPACNEEAVIGECLQSLLSQDFDGGVQVVVVANGCTDATVELARSYRELMAARGVEFAVVETHRACKAHALNAGDVHAVHGNRLYLDADAALSANALSSITRAFGRDGVRFCSPRPLTVAATYTARVYARIWSHLPYVRHDVIGAGAYAVRGDARSRWDRFPDIIADDKFARLHFTAGERRVLEDCRFLMYLPVGFGELVSVRSRWIRANRELRRRFPVLAATDKRRLAGVPRFVVRHPRLWRDMPVFAAIYACAEVRALLPHSVRRWERADGARDVRRPAGRIRPAGQAA
jgi:glycosyltransferase involved in cell wall biosynthesis